MAGCEPAGSGSTPDDHPIAFEVPWWERLIVNQDWAGSIPVEGATPTKLIK